VLVSLATVCFLVKLIFNSLKPRESNNEIVEYMKQNNLKTFENLEEKYIQRLVDNIDQLNASSVVWQEVR
jgi:hypothetical protein